MKSGFSIIELVVTIAIVLAITSIVIYGQQSFNQSVVMENLSHEISLLFRQQQARAINVAMTEEGYNLGYGIDVDAHQKSPTLRLFLDRGPINNPPTYDGGFTENGTHAETLEDTFVLPPALEITDLCIEKSNGDIKCTSDSDVRVTGNVNNFNYGASYVRPFIEPYMMVKWQEYNGSSWSNVLYRNNRSGLKQLNAIYLKIGTATAGRYVKIGSGGQISVITELSK